MSTTYSPQGPLPRLHVFPAEDSLAYAQPMPSRAPLGTELRQVTRIFTRRWLTVFGTAAAAMLLMLVFIWVVTPLYRAEVQILIDPRQKQTVGGEIAPTGLGSSAVGADTLLLDSQVEVLWSNSIVGRLIREGGLLDDPEFVGTRSSGLTQTFKDFAKTILFGAHDATWKQTSDYDRVLETLHKQMSIKRERNTYVIAINLMSEDAEKAARIVNRLADIYIQETNAAASKLTQDTTDSLQSRLGDLRATAQAAAEKVEAYRREKNLIGTQALLVVEQQLRDLNEQLGRAHIETQSAKALLDQIRSVNALDGRLTASMAQSAVMSQLQLRLAEIESEEAGLQKTLLPRHPRLQRLSTEKRTVEASMTAEYKRILQRLDVNYNSARENENALREQLADVQGRVATSNADSVMLREMERDSQTSQQVYETYLARSKEAREQIDLPTSTARIISSAYAASRPDFPRVPLLLAAALGLGLVLGLALAWLSHVLGADDVPPPRARVRYAA